ncbi:MAG: winged helix-turn-helix domain-containing protein [Chloroflexaceae bacterium]|nr:winged helix-turn-helix domain-containing protein [Chloroflexaceae bacterium]
MTGTTLYTVSRTLSHWEKQGLVETGRERVLIRSLAALKAIAEDMLPPND